MAQAAPRMPTLARALLLLFLAVSGPVLVPVIAYVAGGRLVGPYAGPRGLATYIGAIYADAAAGGLLALAIVLGPLLVAIAWSLRRSLLRRMSRPQAQ